ncbi:uncharacterized protein [Zea mays]|uniref:uncharacterized protein n=1 Tax=Zea mays TaxID=4577 RepID=UPI0004DE9FBD|nr:uncharacterized protein LOC103626128 [Zea mays]|eukprot:XP_008644738.1 uncharacterized protein LOC103626128 [Zea mays]
MMPVAHVVEWTYQKFAKYGMEVPQLTPSRIRLLSCNRTFSCSRAKEQLGYEPLVSLKDGLKRTVESYPHLQAQNHRSISKASIFLGNGNRMKLPSSLVPTHTLYIHSTFVLPHLKSLPIYLFICSCKNSTLGRCEANCDSASTVGCYLLPLIYMWLHLHHSDGKAFVINCYVLIHSWHASIKSVQSFILLFIC